MSYANETRVPIYQSQGELQKILAKYKATGFAYGENEKHAQIMFELSNRRIRFVLPMPQKPSQYATKASIKTYEQLCRSQWRCLLLAIKAKLQSVESKITTLEEEFLAHIVLPNGQSVGSVMIPQIAESYSSRKMPPLLGFDK